MIAVDLLLQELCHGYSREEGPFHHVEPYLLRELTLTLLPFSSQSRGSSSPTALDWQRLDRQTVQKHPARYIRQDEEEAPQDLGVLSSGTHRFRLKSSQEESSDLVSPSAAH
jgi:hypothetical protein